MAKEESKIVKYLDSKVQIKGKPSVGENVPVYVRPGDKIDLESLGLNLETAKFKLVGGDMILDIPDGGSFTFVSLALMGYGDNTPEFLGTAGKVVSLGAILSNIDEINALPINSVVTNEFVNMPNATSDQEKKNKTTEEKKNETPPQVIVIDNNPATEENNNISLSLAESQSQAPSKAPDVAQTEFTSNSTKTQSKKATQAEKSSVEGIEPTLSFDIDIQHV